MGDMVARTLRAVADGDALFAPQPAMELLELIVRQLPTTQRVATINIDSSRLAHDGTLIEQSMSDTPPNTIHDDSTNVSGSQPRGMRVGEFLVYLVLGRPALSPDDAFEPAVQKLPNAIVTLISRDLGDANGQWVTTCEWLAGLRGELKGEVMPLTAKERTDRRRQRILSVAGSVAVTLISIIIVFYALTSWASS